MMTLSHIRDNAHPQETLDNLTTLVQTATETVTKVVTDIITMRGPTFYESVSYITHTKHFGIERPTTVYEATTITTVYETTTVEPSILPTITVYGPQRNVECAEAMIIVSSRIFWSVFVAAVVSCIVFIFIWVATLSFVRSRRRDVLAGIGDGPRLLPRYRDR